MKDPLNTHIIVTHRNNIDTYTFWGYYVCINNPKTFKRKTVYFILYKTCGFSIIHVKS